MNDLKERAIRGGFAKVCAQAASFIIRIACLMVLARLLEPKDFGLVGMVTAITGIMNLFQEFGLSTATVQRAVVTDEQVSTLFWINILVGLMLALLLLAMAPMVAAFYHEPRLFAVTAVLASAFIFNAAGVQHSALLQREMSFTSLAVIDIISLLAGAAVSIAMAIAGYGYWALVALTVTLPLVSTTCTWLRVCWIPGMPRRQVGVRSMMRLGGTVTLNGLVIYVAYNLDKVLLGRFWGADAIGIYGRAYQLINLPISNLNAAIGGVAFSALSRIQDDVKRFRSYFLKSYSLVLGLTIPITIICALFANDLIAVVLGPKWSDTVILFRLLAPTIFLFALINPLGWVMYSLGLVGRSLKVALVLAPIVIAGYLLGLPYGPRGVAFGFSAALILWCIPHILWCVHGTVISFRDILSTVSRPLLSGIIAAILGATVQVISSDMSPLTRLLAEGAVLVSTYLVMLLYVMGQGRFYFDLVGGLLKKDFTGSGKGHGLITIPFCSPFDVDLSQHHKKAFDTESWARYLYQVIPAEFWSEMLLGLQLRLPILPIVLENVVCTSRYSQCRLSRIIP